MSLRFHFPLALAIGFALSTPSGSSAGTELGSQGAGASSIPARQDTAFIRWRLVADRSEARYRVREQLAGFDLPSDAVGATSSMSGDISVASDGTIDTQSSEFRIDLTSLTTDSNMRDNYVRRRTLQVEEYPEAVLIPLRFLGLTFPLAHSGTADFHLETDLTLHGVTQTVTWAVTADLSPSTVTGVATTSFPFQLFDLTKPSVARVLSVADTIRLELDFVMEREGGRGTPL